MTYTNDGDPTNPANDYVFIWFIEGGYSDSRMTTLHKPAGHYADDDDMLVDYVLNHWMADDDEVLSIAVGKRYAERTIYNARGIDG